MKHLRYYNENKIDWTEDWEEEDDGDDIPCTIYKTTDGYGGNSYLPIFKYKNKDCHLASIDETNNSYNEHVNINGYDLEYVDYTSLMDDVITDHMKDNIIEDIKNDKQLLQNDYGDYRNNRTFKYSNLKKYLAQ